ncbi:MAG: hypothetical protein K0U20_08690 [Proteobacteria bacterium]|nr:hypothetical protein [Pseudomonadota bacterium]
MSEYLNRLKHLSTCVIAPGNAPNVQSNVSIPKAIDYIEKLEADIVNLENQRNADATILRCGIAANYVMPINGAPVSLNDRLFNKAIDNAIEVVNEHYEVK